MRHALIARGDAPSPRAIPPIHSPLSGVPDAAWTRLVCTLETAPLRHISESNGLGCYEMRPRRLGDLGLMTDLHIARRGKRQIWEGTFVPPLTQIAFLANPILQYSALAESIARYDVNLNDLPEGVSRSGALAILHRAGPSGLTSWMRTRIPSTERLFERTNEIF